MNISVVGAGYVGLVVGACLAETGNDVICADVVESKIEGHEVKAPEPVEEGGKLVDLMAALEASVNAAKAARSGEKPVSVAEAKKAREGRAERPAASRKAATKTAEKAEEGEAAAPARTRKRKTA